MRPTFADSAMYIELESAGLGAWLLFILVGLGFAAIGMLTSKLLRRKSTQAGAYATAYECGEEPVGSTWVPFHPRYYVVAILFLLFEVEIALLYPWASVALVAPGKGGLAGPFGGYAFALGLGFVLLLALGLVYAWARGSLDWKVAANTPTPHHPLPAGSAAYRSAFAAPKQASAQASEAA